MLFEQNHNLPPLDSNNYELYFLLYVDGELTPEQMARVEAFAAARPELHNELTLLLSTRLPQEHFVVDKESLLAAAMPAGSVQEDLLLYIDGELPAHKEKELSFELAGNPAFQLQYQQLLAAKLDAGEQLPHPNRAELYRTERRIAPVWLRIAAAVLVVAGLGTAYFALQPTNTMAGTTPSVAVQPSGKQPAQPTTIQPGVLAKIKGTPNAATKKAQVAVAVQQTPKKHLPQTTVKELVAVAPVEVTLAADDNTAAKVTDLQVQPATAYAASASVAGVPNAVTSPLSAALEQQNRAAEVTDMVSNDKDRKGSLKAFFRKATRVIGRTTGIGEDDDEGKVAIGALALKLR